MKKYKMIINGEKYEAKILSYKGNEARVNVNGIDYVIEVEQENTQLSQPIIQASKLYLNPEKVSSTGSKVSTGQLVAPIPGIVIDVHKKVGDLVEAGDVLMTVEAMKMESELVAPVSGKISEMNKSKGDSVLEGELLVVINTSDARETAKHNLVKTGKKKEPPRLTPATKSDGSIKAPIPGTVIEIRVKEGDKVSSEDTVLIIEAMKMESEIRAEIDGTIKRILVSKGTSVNEGDVLMIVGE